MWIHIAVLVLLSCPFWKATIQFKQPLFEESQLSIMSHNMARLNLTRSNKQRHEYVEFLKEENADIMCFQEFTAANNLFEELDNYFLFRGGRSGSSAIFSKFPILDSGTLILDSNKTNNIVFCDILVQSDTIRVYNAHLESMGIDPQAIQNREGIQSEYENVKLKLLRGSKERTIQIDILIKHARNSGYPIVVAGDFNDVPFSYNYYKLKKEFKNGFEERGKGMGITYNGKIPFLRIDNQFFSDGLEIVSFTTLNEVSHSDHYPIIGNYKISD